MENSGVFNSGHLVVGRITVDYPTDISVNSDRNHIQLLRTYLGLENEDKVSKVSDGNRELLLRCLQREENPTHQDDREMKILVHGQMHDKPDIGSPEMSSPAHEHSGVFRKDPTSRKLGNPTVFTKNWHNKFRSNAYVVPVKMYNPATAISSAHPNISHRKESQTVASQITTTVKPAKEVGDSDTRFLFSVAAQPFYPTIPQASLSSMSSCVTDGDVRVPEPLCLLSHVIKETGVSVKDTRVSAEDHPSDGGHRTASSFVADQVSAKTPHTSISPPPIASHHEISRAATPSIGNSFSEGPMDKAKQPEAKDDPVPMGVGVTLHQILKDLSTQTSNHDHEQADDPHAIEDDVASLNTRNEYWSISSFHSRTAPLEDGHQSTDEDLPSPPEELPDFELPIESLMKPIRKNTYNPITQEGVNQFLESATWHADSAEESSPIWTAKNIPLQPVEIASATVRSDRRDRFLESIDLMRRNEEETRHLVSDVSRRHRMERNPSSETFYAGYVREENPGYTEEHFIRRVTVISTQTTPEWYLRQSQQMPLHRGRETAQQEHPEMPPSSSIPTVTHKECVICREKQLLENYPQATHMSEHDICNLCTARYLEIKVLRDAVVNICCPAEQCSFTLEYNDIQELAEPRIFTKFDELLSRKAYEEDPNFRWCNNRSCTTGQIVEDGETSTHYTCPSCNFKSCFRCKSPAHPPLACAENMTNLHNENFAADEESGQWLKIYTKPCSCGRWIQKMDGCDHVKCPASPVGCGDEWCWMCGAKYDDIRQKGNTAHKGDCPHYA